ncbi:MAG: tetratricopeptide repeat protein [Chloroflexota bacterium]
MKTLLPSESFGDLLKFLRKRAHLTQRDLAASVGYTEAHLSRLENNERLPDLTTIAALFIPALELKDDPAMMERLLKLAAQARDPAGRAPAGVRIERVTVAHETEVELGALEDIPAPPAHYVERVALAQRVSDLLARERAVALCDMAGMGKTTLAAAAARAFPAGAGPVFWHTLAEGVNTSAEAIIRQLALFLLANGGAQVRPLVEPRADSAPIPLDQQILLLRAALAERPSLLCFEDVHLLRDQESSLALLRHLGTTTAAWLLLTSRQELDLPFQQINVGGLEMDEARALMDQMGVRLESESLERLLAKTDCNPMALRLAAAQLADPRADSRAVLDHIETQPQVASYLLNTVLEDLPDDSRWLADLLATFRQPADLYDDALAALIRKARLADLEAALRHLRSRHLVENARRAELHPLVRDYLYASLSAQAARKKRLHRLAAQWYELNEGNLVEAAHHWTRANNLERAAEALSGQSERILHRGQANAAVLVVDEALARIGGARLARDPKGAAANLRRGLLKSRGDLLRGAVRAAEAEASYREALALAQSQPGVRAEIVRNLAQILMQRGQAAEALRLCQSARASLSPADTVLHARLAAIESRAHMSLSRYDEAERIAHEAIAFADSFAESLPLLADDVRARCERTLGWINYTRHPEGDESLAHYRRALECARRAGLRVIECAVLSNTATALMERGDIDGAWQSYQEALQGYESLGDMYGIAGILHNLGVALANREEYETALAQFERASEIERRIGDREGLLSTDSARASTLVALGKLPEARAVLDSIYNEIRESTDLWTMGTCLCMMTEVQLLQGEIEAARASAERVLSMPGIEDNARIRAWAASGLALTYLAEGDLASARALVSAAPADDLGYELTTRWQLAQLSLAHADKDKAKLQQITNPMLEEARQKGRKRLVATLEQFLANPDLPASELPRLALLGGQ